MNAQRTAYWLALVIAGLAFHSEYQRGAFPALHRAADSAAVTLCRTVSDAERTVAMAKLVITKPELRSSDLLAASQLADARRMAAEQAEMARAEARMQTEMIRERVQEQMRAQAEMMREQIQMEQTQLAGLSTPTQGRGYARIGLSDAMNHRMVVVLPGKRLHSEVRVSVPDLTDLPDDDGDSN
jgi:F0F1-type ATP synthase membrane subunit b/b'